MHAEIVHCDVLLKTVLTKRQETCIIIKLSETSNRGVAQFGRVLGLGPRCRRFESCRLDQFQKTLQKFF